MTEANTKATETKAAETVAAEVKKEPDLSAAGLLASDPQLEGTKKLQEKYASKASHDAIEKTVAALKAKLHKATVVKTKAAALEFLVSLADSKKTYGQGASTTLIELGWQNYLKDHPEAFARNFKGEAAAALGKGDWATAGGLNKLGLNADLFFSSADAVSQNGDILVVDATGTRTGGFAHTAGEVIVVVGSNKLVPDLASGRQRIEEWSLQLESARARIAYAAMGVKGSQIGSAVEIRHGNPYAAPGRIHVVIVEEVLGF